jgi:hypothetical protein
VGADTDVSRNTMFYIRAHRMVSSKSHEKFLEFFFSSIFGFFAAPCAVKSAKSQISQNSFGILASSYQYFLQK